MVAVIGEDGEVVVVAKIAAMETAAIVMSLFRVVERVLLLWGGGRCHSVEGQ